MNPVEQQFFTDLEKKLWTAADKLRSNLDAAVYKHVVLGLIFLKYVSDAFEERQKELREQFTNPDHDYYMDPADFGKGYEQALQDELEARDYYTEKNIFWVPLEARWQTLRDCAQLPPRRRCSGTSRARTSRKKCVAWVGLSTTPWKPSNARTRRNSRTCSTRTSLAPRSTATSWPT
ncbi:type I restriction-modification system subunit M N-terminal domain-containing protein [Pseudomonas sp. ITEM 17296]|uniref:type I restriction-modification system subunit M N-terminal domain-containing protein n=1 Tax=Pseudomonas sp. ITEM 17296 TaxID=2790281 RepID=UPI0031583273